MAINLLLIFIPSKRNVYRKSLYWTCWPFLYGPSNMANIISTVDALQINKLKLRMRFYFG